MDIIYLNLYAERIIFAVDDFFKSVSGLKSARGQCKIITFKVSESYSFLLCQRVVLVDNSGKAVFEKRSMLKVQVMREGKKAGNFQAVNQGAKILMDLNNNFEEHEDAADQMPKMIAITADVSTIRVDRVNYTEEEKRKLAQRVGMSEQQVQELFQQEDGTYRLYEGEEEISEE